MNAWFIIIREVYSDMTSVFFYEILLSLQSGRVYYQAHKVDKFITKPTKWTSLLPSPQSRWVYYQVHKVDEFITVHKLDEFITKPTKWTSLLLSP